jgi:hypothetical protein
VLGGEGLLGTETSYQEDWIFFFHPQIWSFIFANLRALTLATISFESSLVDVILT